MELSAEELERQKADDAKLDAFIDESGDGALVVKLSERIELDGDPVHRLTLRRIRVRDVRAARGLTDDAAIDAYADALVSPAGATEELACDHDYAVVLRAVVRQLGKFREGGRQPSQS